MSTGPFISGRLELFCECWGGSNPGTPRLFSRILIPSSNEVPWANAVPPWANAPLAIEISARPVFIDPLLFPALFGGGGIPFGPWVAIGGGGGLEPVGICGSPINPPINPENPGLEPAIELTAADWNWRIRSGFCLKISSIPGIADLNIVLDIWTIIALPPSWNNNLSSGDRVALDLYFS